MYSIKSGFWVNWGMYIMLIALLTSTHDIQKMALSKEQRW
jgi:hypothetical protein